MIAGVRDIRMTLLAAEQVLDGRSRYGGARP